MEMKQHSISSQILVFESINEMIKFMDDNIRLHRSKLLEYEDKIGQMLRQSDNDVVDEKLTSERFDNLVHEKQASTENTKKNNKKIEKKKIKSSVTKNSTNWRVYSDIQIYTDIPNKGVTEIYFEAVNELKVILEKLDKIKETLSQITTIELNSMFYMVYVKNGIPEKLVLLPQQKQKNNKFMFKTVFESENIEVPIKCEV
jgi:hypothetical protein